ncbi:MAG TPA: hypothetical protein VFJ61_13480 [Solirubrobacterales bacterium]|nr:hypothetical protein [Solirubrobacterales bacterium]
MKYGKHLVAAALALTAFLAFAGVASATTVTSPAGTAFTGTIKATSTDTKLTNSATIGTVSCEHSEVEGLVTSHGGASTAFGDITKLTFTKCSGGEPTSPVTTRGTLEVHLTTAPDGTATSNGASVTVHKTLVGTCTFITKNTDIGTFLGGTPAHLAIGSSPIPQSSGNFFCPSSATWTGNYTVTSPGTLLVS